MRYQELLTAMILSAALAAPVIVRADDASEHAGHDHGAAAGEHEHGAGDADAHGNGAAAGHDHGSGEGGHDMDMHKKHMKDMQDMLDRIKAATDPQEKERLVQQFVDAEQDHMKQMHGMMDKGPEIIQGKAVDKPAPKRGRGGMMGAKGQPDMTERRLDAIDRRLNAIQMSLDRLVRDREAKDVGAPPANQ
jgi:hypothetical protein